MDQKIMHQYGRLIAVSGVNVQPGQLVVIRANPADYKFIDILAEECYKAKAGKVEVHYNDQTLTKLGFEYVDTDILSELPQWQFDQIKSEQDRKGCYINVHSDIPGFLKDVDPVKMGTVMAALMKAQKPLMAYTMASRGQWTVVAVPSVGWAKVVFPQKSDQEAYDLLEAAILKSVYVQPDNDPIAEWEKHDAAIRQHCDKLNALNFKSLHFSNSLGTDLTVQLVKNHIWGGGTETSATGVVFNPNLPTEECFCMPEREGVDGIVHAAKPLSYQGKLIENFWLKFENGRVTDYDAAKGKDILTSLLDTDEGSRHLGEVALISYDTPISLSGILFYNTLFDENASCHLALGQAYPMNLKGGVQMSEEQLRQAGANDSANHCDFMFGTRDLEVTGTDYQGQTIQVFANGNFVI